MDLNEAKRSLGRELRSKEGFVGVGTGNGEIRLYALDEGAPVVEFLRARFGTTYRGYHVSVLLSAEKTQFTVDAALLRELGDRLIGQPHIALAELVKNAYDADAHVCRIEIRDDEIVVSDNGHGISEREFHDFWMRIGTTHKVEQETTRRLGRRMTGSKGLGRLSVQYLAEETVLESTVSGSDRMLYAIVDWQNVSSGKDLETVPVVWEMRDEHSRYANDSPFGTRIRLQSLRSKWGSEAIEDLGREVWMLRPPRRYVNRRTQAGDATDFFVDVDAPDIDEVQESFDERHLALLDNWKARISGVLEDGRRSGRGEASVTVEFKGGYPEGSDEPRTVHEEVVLPVRRRREDESPAVDRARFEILVFKTEGRQTSGLSVGEVREYLRKFGNVSVYDAGFRLPYYGSSKDLAGQDWLNVATDQGRRLIASELLPEHLRMMNRYMLDLPAPGRIFGSVEVDTNHEQSAAVGTPQPGNWLRIQPGRDRLTQNAAFEQLRDLVRFSLDLYANRYRALAEDSADRERSREPPRRLLDHAVRILDRHRDDMPRPVFSEVRREVVGVRRAVANEEKSLDRRAVLLAPLATAGIAALAFNHELAREAQVLREIKESLEEMATAQNNRDLERLAGRLEGFEARFQSYRGLFSPLAVREDRQAANRLRVYSVVDQVVGVVRPRMPGVRFHFHGEVDRELRFPRGSFVEWSALLQNVIFNAWNAMLDSPRRVIRFETVELRRSRVALRVSDTGVGLGVSSEEGATLFEPFERQMEISEENRSIAIGGEGLGLAIVRMIALRRQAEVAFAAPRSGYSTTFELAWRQ